jgi:hypothetical protein
LKDSMGYCPLVETDSLMGSARAASFSDVSLCDAFGCEQTLFSLYLPSDEDCSGDELETEDE